MLHSETHQSKEKISTGPLIWSYLLKIENDFVLKWYFNQCLYYRHPWTAFGICSSHDHIAWWRQQMEKKILVSGHFCGEFTGHWWIPDTKPVLRSFGVFFHLRLNKRLSKQTSGRWFETPSHPLWCQLHGIFHERNLCWCEFVTVDTIPRRSCSDLMCFLIIQVTSYYGTEEAGPHCRKWSSLRVLLYWTIDDAIILIFLRSILYLAFWSSSEYIPMVSIRNSYQQYAIKITKITYHPNKIRTSPNPLQNLLARILVNVPVATITRFGLLHLYQQHG